MSARGCWARRFLFVLAAGALGMAYWHARLAESGRPARLESTRAAGVAPQPRVDYARLPLVFEPNEGQTAAGVDFVSRGRGYTLFLTPTESVLALRVPASTPGSVSTPCPVDGGTGAGSSAPSTAIAAVRLRLLGSNPHARPAGRDRLPGVSNYFRGNDPTKWRTNVPQYAKAAYEGVYPGIDLVYYGNQEGRLEHDFVVAPGADPERIALAVEGADSVRLDEGELVVAAGGGEARLRQPVAYQEREGERVEVPCRYELSGRRVRFALAEYDAGQELVIDPILAYSTFLGGSGADKAVGLAIDAAGNAYVSGATEVTDFPTQGPFQATYGGGLHDVFVTKLAPAGDSLVYSTYLGGSDDDYGYDIALDLAGNAYVVGYTRSSDWPTAAAYQDQLIGGRDAFVAKLNASGSALVFSTYLGGYDNDEAHGIAVDSSAQVYVAGKTNSYDFPTVNATQQYCGGYDDAFLTKFSASGDSLGFSTYLGGSGDDYAGDLALGSGGVAYLTGFTSSTTDFPLSSPRQASFGGGYSDAFVTAINTASSTVVYSTYHGGSGDDEGAAIAVDGLGAAYVTGITYSGNFPVQAAYQPSPGGSGDAFVSKFSASGTTLAYSTYLGGGDTDYGKGIVVDSGGRAYVSGTTQSGNYPLHLALQSNNAGASYDGFVTKLSASGGALEWSTFLGGTGYDEAIGIAVHSSGAVYAAGLTGSEDFPTSHAYQTAANTEDAFVAKIDYSDLGTYAVTHTRDLGAGSLREAIVYANNHPGPDTITFNIAGAGPHTIQPTSPLPNITEQVTIDGYSQPGASPNTLAVGDNAVIQIDLDGTLAGTSTNGLTINASDCVVRGLAIRKFQGRGIHIETGSGHTVSGCFLGTDVTGLVAQGNAQMNIRVSGTGDNTIGGTTPAARNVICAAGLTGIYVAGSSCGHNVIRGNYIGVGADGATDLGNGQEGIAVHDANTTTIGGDSAACRNVIAGNVGAGVKLINATGNVIAGNYIGVAADGATAVPNDDRGVMVTANSTYNTIGGTSEGARNVISGNAGSGIQLEAGSDHNTVVGNYIGINATGNVAVPNSSVSGVSVLTADNTIGGTTVSTRNVISGNTGHGVLLSGAAGGNTVQGNYIGTNAAGDAALPNSGHGIFVDTGANDAVIGGNTGTNPPGTPPGNLISGNTGNNSDGIRIVATHALVRGNLIGLAAGGSAGLNNGGFGVAIADGLDHVVGGGSQGDGNVISNNDDGGIAIFLPASQVTVAGNYIGTKLNGAEPRGNGVSGVLISGSSGNTIGGTTAAERNVISGNGGAGVEVTGSYASGNTIAGNYIGTNDSGMAAIPNGAAGVVIHNEAHGNTVGGSAAPTGTAPGNVISGNQDAGVVVAGYGAVDNVVVGNLIGLDAAGTGAVGNGGGVRCGSTPGPNTIGGSSGGLGNVISGNGDSNIRLVECQSTTIRGNYIGTDRAGTANLGTDTYGILIDDASNNTIGGLGPGEGNRIAFNGTGVAVASGTGNRIRGNRIWGNAGLGIDLGDDGVTVNDGSDADSGPNNLQNFASVTLAATDGYSMRVGVELSSDGSYTAYPVDVDFYRTVTPDATNHGEGEFYLGSGVMAGPGELEVAGLPAVPAGEWVTATATDANGNTSEFCRSWPVVQVTAGQIPVTNNYDRWPGSLRDALGKANGAAGSAVVFRIPDFLQAGGVYTISLASPLPDVVGSGVMIDGLTQTSYTGNTNPAGPEVVLDGSGLSAGSGLSLLGSNQTVRGLVIGGCPDAGVYLGGGASGSKVEGCFIGTDATGTSAVANGTGVVLEEVGGNTVGGTGGGAGNVISGNTDYGVEILGPVTVANYVQGNRIGTDAGGGTSLGNGLAGVYVASGASNQVIGGTVAAARNVISGNEVGVYIAGLANGNLVQGNYIGTNGGGTAGVPNSTAGVLITYASGNVIGGSTGTVGTPPGNVIAGNVGAEGYGVWVSGELTDGNRIEGNLIGLRAGGAVGLANGGDGVHLEEGATNSVVVGNVVGGNGGHGVVVVSSDPDAPCDGTRLLGNRIGTNAAGDAAVANAGCGVVLSDGAVNTVVGDGTSGGRNLISGNAQAGLLVATTGGVVTGGSERAMGGAAASSGGPASGTTVQGNWIGLKSDGTGALGNGGGGIRLGLGATGTVVGGAAAGAANVIAHNTGSGITVSGNATGNRFTRNRIHSNTRIGIDLVGGTENAAGVTLNDPGDADEGPNTLLNYPVLEEASLTAGGSALIVEGWARPGSVVEVYRSSGHPSGFGSGQTFLAAATEGSGQDLDAGSSSYGGTINGLSQGSDTTNRFRFQLTVTGVSVGDRLTATATLGDNTSEFSGNVTVVGAPSALVFGVQPRNGVAGQALARFEVRVQNALGEVATGDNTTEVTVALANNPTGAALSGTLRKRVSAGVAAFEDVVIERAGTGYTLRATAPGLAEATSGAFDIVAGAAHHLKFERQPQDGVAGERLAPVTVWVEDAFNNLRTGDNSTEVSLALDRSGAREESATRLSGTLRKRVSGGVATFDDLVIEGAGTGLKLTASASGLPAVASASFAVRPATGSRLRFVTEPTTTVAGAVLTPAVTVEVVDAYGNRVDSGAAVTLGVTGQAGLLLGTVTRAASAGLATFGDLRIERAGTGYTLRATAAGLAEATSAAFDITAGGAVGLRFATEPGDIRAGEVFTPSVAVELVDGYGNRTSSGAMVTLSGVGGVPLVGTTTVAASAGLATFGDVSVERAGSWRLAAASGGLSATSQAFQVLPAGVDAGKSKVTASPDSVRGDGVREVAVTVTLVDAYENPVPGVGPERVLLTTSPSGPASGVLVSGPAAATDASGQTQGVLRRTRPGLVQVGAQVDGVALASTAEVRFTPRLVSAERSSVELVPERVSADGEERARLTVTLRDAGGVAVEGSPVAGRSLSAPAGVTLVEAGAETGPDGVFVMQVTASSPGEHPLVVSVAGVRLPGVTLTARSYYDLLVPAGLSLQALPFTPDEDSLAEWLATPGVQVVIWDAPSDRYVALGPESAGRIGPGVGFWVRAMAAQRVRLRGEPGPEGAVTLPLERGWNLLGNPHGGRLAWRLSSLGVASRATLADEGLWSTLVAPYGWTYEPGTGRYRLVFDRSRPGFEGVADAVEAGGGFWVLCQAEQAELTVPAPAAERSARAAEEVTARDWHARLRAENGGESSEVLVGLSSRQRRVLAVESPPAVEAGGLRLAVVAGERSLAGEVRPWSAGPQEFELAVTAGADGEVRLTWPSLLRSLPRGVTLELTDLASERTVLLNTRSSYVWRAGAGEVRRLRLTSRYQNLSRTQVVSLTVTPTRGRGVSVALSLTGPAEVTVVVRGLRGAVVREFRETVEAAGLVNLSWDGLDAAGRRAPAGTYVIEATAHSPNGALSRTTRIVTVR